MRLALLALVIAGSTGLAGCDTGAPDPQATRPQDLAPKPSGGVSVSGYARLGVSHSF